MRIKTLDQFNFRRVIGLIYGKPKAGKTTCALKLVLKGHRLLYFSYDYGARKLMKNLMTKGQQSPFYNTVALFIPGLDNQGKRVNHVVHSTLEDLREAELELHAWGKEFGYEKIWLVIDTVTHLQVRALSEARYIQIGRQATNVQDKAVRDAVTQVDYQVNLGQMRDLADRVSALPCNILYIANETTKQDRQDKPVYHPAIMGQTYNAIVGDVDFVFRLVVYDNERVFKTRPSPAEEAGYRDGSFDPEETADLDMVWERFQG